MASPKTLERNKRMPKQTFKVLRMKEVPVGEIFRMGKKLYVKSNSGQLHDVDKLSPAKKDALKREIARRERLKQVLKEEGK